MNRLTAILLLNLLLSACVPVTSHAQPVGAAASQPVGIRFGLTLAGDVYSVWMEPTVTPDDPNLTLSIQVTLKVPHGEGSDRFVLRNLQSGVPNVLWAQLSRVDAPVEAPSSDYISIEAGYVGGNRGAFGWRAGQRVEAFRFENAGRCLGAITLVENHDPFVPQPGSTNSVSTNPGNYIRVVGLSDENAYLGNLTGPNSSNCQIRSDVRIESSLVHLIGEGINRKIEILWGTHHEADLLSFNLLRQLAGQEVVRLNQEPLLANHAGQLRGSSYHYIDESGSPDANLNYILELILFNGETLQHFLGPVMRGHVFLPLITH